MNTRGQELLTPLQGMVENNKLILEIEDRINRYTLQFDSPKGDKNNDQLIHGVTEIGMLARVPGLRMDSTFARKRKCRT